MRGDGAAVPSPDASLGASPSESDGGEPWASFWPCLASFTPTGEAGNEATVVSLASLPLRPNKGGATWGVDACSGVAKSGKPFNSVPFGSISTHFLSSTRGRGARFPPARERRLHSCNRRIQPAYNHCKGGQGYGVMGSCRLFLRTARFKLSVSAPRSKGRSL